MSTDDKEMKRQKRQRSLTDGTLFSKEKRIFHLEDIYIPLNHGGFLYWCPFTCAYLCAVECIDQVHYVLAHTHTLPQLIFSHSNRSIDFSLSLSLTHRHLHNTRTAPLIKRSSAQLQIHSKRVCWQIKNLIKIYEITTFLVQEVNVSTSIPRFYKKEFIYCVYIYICIDPFHNCTF